MAVLRREGGKLIREFDGETLWLEAWGAGIRVRATRHARMPEEDWALIGSAAAQADIRIDGQTASLSSGTITASISPNGALSFYDKNGKLLLQERWRTRAPGSGKFSALEIPGRELRPISGGDFKIFERFEPVAGEKIFGMGQYQDGVVDRKGSSVELAHRNSQASVPFSLSSAGYGFLWNNPAIGRATFATNGTVWEAETAKALDFWVVAGGTPAEIVEAYADATGKPPMMPDWAMGFWQCKLRYMTQEELLEVAREYKRRNLPLSVIVADFFHWTLQGEWKFDPMNWPDPAAMVRELQDMGVELMVSIWPTVDMRSENYEEMREKGYLVQTDRGVRPQMLFMGNSAFFDATHPGARAFVWSKVKKNYYKHGIHVFWLDEAEPEYNEYDFDNYRYHIGPVLQAGNIYPMKYSQAFYDGLAAEGRKDIVNLVRCAWAGSQRYGALLWSGDIDTTFEALREQMAIALSIGMSGIPWWTTDIGGFSGGEQGDPAYRELLIRWFQFGAFCPVFRLHGDRLNGHGWDAAKQIAGTGGPNEVWSYGEEAYGILCEHIFMRERLRPYIKGIMEQAHRKGTPPMRPLFYDFPDDRAAWEVEDEFMFGPDILVAPVLYPGMRSRSVYLPAGASWKEAHTGTTYRGGQAYTVDAPIEYAPVFLRNGADLPIARQ